MKLYSLLQQDRNVVGKRKVFFIVPAVIVVIALIAGIIFGIASGNPMNLGADFKDGYAMQIRSTAFTQDNFKDYDAQIRDIVKNLSDDDGDKYGLRVYETKLQGIGESTSIYVKYSRVRGNKTEAQTRMTDEINPKLQDEIQSIFRIKPVSAKYESGKAVLSYGGTLTNANFNSIKALIISYLAQNSITVADADVALSADRTVITVNGASVESKLDGLKTAAKLELTFAGKAEEGQPVTATLSNAFLAVAIIAVISAILMLAVYIAFRFEVSAAVAVAAGIACDLLLMIALMTVFHIKFNTLFFASAALVLVFSAISKVAVFDRIRESKKFLKNKSAKRPDLANDAIRDTMVRNFNSTVIMLAFVALTAIIAVPAVRLFAVAALFGIASTAFTTVCLTPSIWTLFKGVEVVRRVKAKKVKTPASTELRNVVDDSRPARRRPAEMPEIIPVTEEAPVYEDAIVIIDEPVADVSPVTDEEFTVNESVEEVAVVEETTVTEEETTVTEIEEVPEVEVIAETEAVAEAEEVAEIEEAAEAVETEAVAEIEVADAEEHSAETESADIDVFAHDENIFNEED